MRTFQNLLVTGGAGFIGSNLVRYILTKTNHTGRVINLDALTYAGNLANLADINDPRYHFVRADIRDRAALAEIFDKYEIDAVCHLAAESHVDRSIVAPDDFVQTNIVGTFNLLQVAKERTIGFPACRQPTADRLESLSYKAGKPLVLFHHVSTDEVFGSLGETGAFTETTPYDPHSPYSASKAASDHLVRAYHDTYGLPVTISNCSNNYGPYQFPEKLIPLMILNALEGKPLPVYGAGTNVRDWLHVEDHCSAIWAIMTRGMLGRTYCVGGRCEMKNIDVVKRICKEVDSTGNIGLRPVGEDTGQRPMIPVPAESLITYVKDRPGHDLRYAIDCTRLETELGWKQKHNAETGFRETVKWYIENKAWVEGVRTGEYRKWLERNYGERK